MIHANPPHPAGRQHRFALLPTTLLGNWAVGLAAANVLLMLSWTLTRPVGAPLGLAVGLAGGVVALAAILRRAERAILVWVALLPFLMAIVFLLAEFLLGHA
jgi:hypothetical protein